MTEIKIVMPGGVKHWEAMDFLRRGTRELSGMAEMIHTSNGVWLTEGVYTFVKTLIVISVQLNICASHCYVNCISKKSMHT